MDVREQVVNISVFTSTKTIQSDVDRNKLVFVIMTVTEKLPALTKTNAIYR